MSYPGGKHGSGVYQQIINRIPPHDAYIEPFLGGGAIMRLKRPARVSIGIDADPYVIKARQDLDTPNLTLLETDGIRYLEEMLIFPDSFVYCDPPYLMDTRSSGRVMYTHELSDEDHIRLLHAIIALDCMIMISGYPNAMYDNALPSWHTHTFKTTNRGGGHVTEKLWMNYPQPHELHDYRYLGSNFRDRERLKRKKERWTARLRAMPDLERLMLAAAITETSDTGHHHQKESAAPVPTIKNGDLQSPDPAILTATSSEAPMVDGDELGDPIAKNGECGPGDFDTVPEMECAISRYFNTRRNIIVPNVSWGLGFMHELDLLVMTPGGRCFEIEIKTSKADLKRDLLKQHGHKSNRIARLYFAIPARMKPDINLIPEEAGILVVGINGRVSELRKAQLKKAAVSLSIKDTLNLSRLGVMRIWTLKKSLMDLAKNYEDLRKKGEKQCHET